MIELNRIYNEDCLEGMKRIPAQSVDMILCDLPYGTTACKWDSIIPFEHLWGQYEMNGIKPLWASEVEPYPIAVTKSRFKEVRNGWTERTVTGNE